MKDKWNVLNDVSFTLISIVSRSAWKCANYQNDLDKNKSLCFVTRWCCNHRVSSTNQHLKSQFNKFFLWRRRFLCAGFITSTRNFHSYLVFYLIFAEKNYFCVCFQNPQQQNSSCRSQLGAHWGWKPFKTWQIFNLLKTAAHCSFYQSKRRK